MKSIIISIISLVFFGSVANAQIFQGSIAQGSNANSVDILFQPSYNSASGEYVNGASVSIAIPLAQSIGTVPVITPMGSFSGLTFVPAIPASYTLGTEKIYSWIATQITPLAMSWTANTSFIGAHIAFTGPNYLSTAQVKLVDFSNLGGGTNSNTLFYIVTNKPPFDAYNPASLFYASAGPNGSMLGTYPVGDQYVQSMAFVTLPVKVNSFEAIKGNTDVKLSWTVTGEYDVSRYEVEHSTDGISFGRTVASVNATGQAGVTGYQSHDDKPVSGNNYYRLKMIGNDNRAEYSGIRRVVFDGAGTGNQPFDVNVWPNPVVDKLQLQITGDKGTQATIAITDLTGRVLATHNITEVRTELPMSALPAGTYIVNYADEAGHGRSFKIVKD